MRAISYLTLFLAVLGFLSGPAHAQDTTAADDASLYTITDVAADVTGDNAVKARDKAVAQAQRDAFLQLVQRLGAADSIGKNPSDDDIAAMVKSFEVQNERTSAVRYIGTFKVHFRPLTVRKYLGTHNATYSEVRSEPVVVLPVTMIGDKAVLWEDKTKWRNLWETSAASSGLVPIIIPSGDLQDIAAISTAESVKGQNLKAIIDKYKAHGAVVAILTGDLEKSGEPYKVDINHFNADGSTLDAAQITAPAATSKSTISNSLSQAIKQTRHQLEVSWQKEDKAPKQPEAPAVQVFDEPQQTSPVSTMPRLARLTREDTNRLVAVANINSLGEWTHIENKLQSVPQIVRVGVASLQRGSTQLEIEYRGDIDGLKAAIAEQYLILQEDRMSHIWIIRPAQPNSY